MSRRFTKHYTRDEAQALLPQVRQWLDQLRHWREQIDKADRRLSHLMSSGADAGGRTVNDWARHLTEMRAVLIEFERRQVQIKDLERGLVDFPAILGGREVFLCWEQDDGNVEYWHDLDSGYTSRERL